MCLSAIGPGQEHSFTAHTTRSANHTFRVSPWQSYSQPSSAGGLASRQREHQNRGTIQLHVLPRFQKDSQSKLFTLLDLCVSSVRGGHANLLCIVPSLTDNPWRESKTTRINAWWFRRVCCLCWETAPWWMKTVSRPSAGQANQI